MTKQHHEDQGLQYRSGMFKAGLGYKRMSQGLNISHIQSNLNERIWYNCKLVHLLNLAGWVQRALIRKVYGTCAQVGNLLMGHLSVAHFTDHTSYMSQFLD